MSRFAMHVLWPAFLVAILAEGCFFSLFDPHLLAHAELAPVAGYTIGFFFFWSVGALAGALTRYLANAPDGKSL